MQTWYDMSLYFVFCWLIENELNNTFDKYTSINCELISHVHVELSNNGQEDSLLIRKQNLQSIIQYIVHRKYTNRVIKIVKLKLCIIANWNMLFSKIDSPDLMIPDTAWSWWYSGPIYILKSEYAQFQPSRIL